MNEYIMFLLCIIGLYYVAFKVKDLIWKIFGFNILITGIFTSIMFFIQHHNNLFKINVYDANINKNIFTTILNFAIIYGLISSFIISSVIN